MRDNLSSLEEGSDLKKLEGSFDLLFDKVQPLSLVEGNLTLLVPSDFYKEYLNRIGNLRLIWVKENNVNLTWDEEVGQYVGQTTVGNATKYIWMEDERSMKLKMDAVKEADLAGVAVWKLGLEPKEIWDVISYK